MNRFSTLRPLDFSQQQQGFSTILALLLTGFLLTLSAGVLFLFLSESRTNQSLFNGIGAYYAADGASEYALLKIKNHREGFEDGISMTLTGSSGNVGDFEGERIGVGKGPRGPRIQYDITAAGKIYTGAIQPNAFEIIPLFVDPGEVIKSQADGKELKHPDANKVVIPLSDFLLKIQSGEKIVWNVIGNDTTGATYGISGILGDGVLPIPKYYSEGEIGTRGAGIMIDTKGKFRKLDTGVLTEEEGSIATFLSTYNECYLVLFNPGVQVTKYEIKSDKNFTLPRTKILASGRMRDSVINLELTEDKSKLFELLKYSLYIGN